MDHDKRIKLLADELVKALSRAYTDNDLVQQALNQIEEEGYRVDILLAAFTRVDREDDDAEDEDEDNLVSADQITSSILNIGGHPEDCGHETLEDDDSPLSAEFNDFDMTFAKLIRVRLGHEE